MLGFFLCAVTIQLSILDCTFSLKALFCNTTFAVMYVNMLFLVCHVHDLRELTCLSVCLITKIFHFIFQDRFQESYPVMSDMS